MRRYLTGFLTSILFLSTLGQARASTSAESVFEVPAPVTPALSLRHARDSRSNPARVPRLLGYPVAILGGGMVYAIGSFPALSASSVEVDCTGVPDFCGSGTAAAIMLPFTFSMGMVSGGIVAAAGYRTADHRPVVRALAVTGTTLGIMTLLASQSEPDAWTNSEPALAVGELSARTFMFGPPIIAGVTTLSIREERNSAARADQPHRVSMAPMVGQEVRGLVLEGQF